MKSRLTFLNACYNSGQNDFSFRVVSKKKKNINVKVYMTPSWPFVLHVDEASSLALREKHWLRFLEEGVEETFSPK